MSLWAEWGSPAGSIVQTWLLAGTECVTTGLGMLCVSVCVRVTFGHIRAAARRGPNTVICVHKGGIRLPTSCTNSSTSCHRHPFVGVLHHHVCPTDSFHYITLLIHIAAWDCNTPCRGQWIQLPVETWKYLNQNKYSYLSFCAYSFRNCHGLGCTPCFMAVVAFFHILVFPKIALPKS